MKPSTLFQASALTVLVLAPSAFSQPATARKPPAAPSAVDEPVPYGADSAELHPDAEGEVRRQVGKVRNTFGGTFDSGGRAFAFAGPFPALDQPLIVSSENLKPAQLDEIREDMRIMAKLLEDSIADTGGNAQERRAMGIVVQSFSGGGSRDLFILGHGAVFQNSVPFPLAAQLDVKKMDAATPSGNSAWEAARREVRGENDPFDPMVSVERRPEFSAERVESLKKGVLKALANAHNFRHLGDDDTVTVVVTSSVAGRRSGADAFGMAGMGGRAGGGGGGTMGGGFGGYPGRTMTTSTDDTGRPTAPATMTISVKKSDAAALADGRITEDEFRSRAKIAVY